MPRSARGPFAIALGHKLKERRNTLGLTRVQVAYAVNRSYESLVNWERGSSVPELTALMELAQMYGCTVNDLLPPVELARNHRHGK